MKPKLLINLKWTLILGDLFNKALKSLDAHLLTIMRVINNLQLFFKIGYYLFQFFGYRKGMIPYIFLEPEHGNSAIKR